MAQFKVKNLMIDVAHADAVKVTPDICLFPSKGCDLLLTKCPGRSFIPCGGVTLDCRVSCLITKGCGINYTTCYKSDVFVIDLEQLVIHPEDIKMVQKDLNEVMKAVESRASEVAKDMRPKTAEELRLVEAQLKGALEELKQIKKEIG